MMRNLERRLSKLEQQSSGGMPWELPFVHWTDEQLGALSPVKTLRATSALRFEALKRWLFERRRYDE